MSDSHHNGTGGDVVVAVGDGGANHGTDASIATTTEKSIPTKVESATKSDEEASSGDGDEGEDDPDIVAMREDLKRYHPRGPPSKPAHGTGVRVKR